MTSRVVRGDALVDLTGLSVGGQTVEILRIDTLEVSDKRIYLKASVAAFSNVNFAKWAKKSSRL